MIFRGAFWPLFVLAALAGGSFLLLEEEAPAPAPEGSRAEVRNIVLDRFGSEGRIQLSATRAVFSPDGVLRLESPKLQTMRKAGEDVSLESAEGEMSPEYEELLLREIRGEALSSPPLRFRGKRMRYVLATGELSGGEARFERDGQMFTAGKFIYAPEGGAKFSDGVRGIFSPQKN